MSNYFNFKDPVSNNTMLIHVNSLNANSDNTVLVTCTNFFTGNKLIFKANSSAIVNVWTSLGQPTFTIGVWNNQNYTATITLSNDSTGKLSWNVYI